MKVEASELVDKLRTARAALDVRLSEVIFCELEQLVDAASQLVEVWEWTKASDRPRDRGR